MFFCLFHFFSETADWIELKFYIGLSHKAQWIEQDEVYRMHNDAKISIIMGNHG